MFIWTGKYITAINKKFICLFFIWIIGMISIYTENEWILKTILKITTLCGFSLIHLMIFCT